ncbi:hypothetical protein BU25DRAFT_345214 [Macroventuria anomochaeta]|uniref:Uncharacterized protein n=1 Tax=Macroventuria anomochaeta TaxID=301207 RepID=A0ACB6RVN6_9PLEO|nr:uncharacterized protein BU25DRAFT_345214 [Macroventuria anomochaeta]KAF2625798.1 hypothetical protein BU25DRAFT_345214 [Macroventuria anomochaeta]
MQQPLTACRAIDLNHTLVNLFTEFSEELSEDNKKRVQDVIDAVESDILSPQAAPSVGSLGKRARKSSVEESPDQNSPRKRYGEAHVTASVGSNEDLDFLDEDLLRTRESRETGYVGQNSEVQWLRSVQRQSQRNEGEPHGLPYGPPGTSAHAIDERSKALHQRRQEGDSAPIRHVTDATFYLDSDNIELDIIINPYELPEPEIAEQLLHCYMSTVHSSFPIVPSSFVDQIRRFIVSLQQNRAFKVPDRWRALMNLIFAIGAKYSHMIGTEWQGDERDHLVYMTRASHLLGMNSAVMFISAPDLSLVQATAVFSFYFLTIGHVSRAWLMVGVSIRLALALGLHLRNEDPRADTTKKEMLLRTWWSLHSIECLLSSITGRPPIISSEDYTVPLPGGISTKQRPASKRQPSSLVSQKIQEESSSASSSNDADDYLISTIDISLLTQRVLASLYAPRTAVRSWQDVQGKIKDLLQGLEDWSMRALSGTVSPGDLRQSEVEREHLLLLVQYWSTKILITRPCLCRTERRIKDESDASAIFNSEMASICVNSARALTALFPHEPDIHFVCMKAPWWNVIHIIMQCAAVLLLEVGYQNRHTKDNNAEITSDIQKLMKWLHAMQPNDPCADRAYHVVRRTLQNVAPALQSKATELLTEGEGSEAADGQSFRPFVSPYRQQQANTNWAQGDFSDGSASVTGHQYYSQASNQDYQDTTQSPRHHSMYGSLPFEDIHMLNTSGNPSINNWDEGVPWAGMQNLWYNPSFSSANMPEDVGDMDLLSTSYTEQEHHQQQSYDAAGMDMPHGQQQRKE